MYIDTVTDSQKLKKVKAVIIICQKSNQIATKEQNYCNSVYISIAYALTFTHAWM